MATSQTPAATNPILRTGATRITTTSQNFIDLVVYFECGGNINKYLNAYLDAGGIPTIGIGTTFYPDGTKVKMGDKGTVDQVYTWFKHEVSKMEQKVESITRDDITQGMFDALVDFAYNLGPGALQSSTLLKVVNATPTNYNAVTAEFIKWVYGVDAKTHQKVVMNGLMKRRKAEAYLYQNGNNAPGFNV